LVEQNPPMSPSLREFILWAKAVADDLNRV